MKKKQRQMIGMLLALVVLAAAFLGIRQYNKNASSATSTTEDTQETVLDVNSDDITSHIDQIRNNRDLHGHTCFSDTSV